MAHESEGGSWECVSLYSNRSQHKANFGKEFYTTRCIMRMNRTHWILTVPQELSHSFPSAAQRLTNKIVFQAKYVMIQSLEVIGVASLYLKKWCVDSAVQCPINTGLKLLYCLWKVFFHICKCQWEPVIKFQTSGTLDAARREWLHILNFKSYRFMILAWHSNDASHAIT